MQQAKISLSDSQIELLSQFEALGFPDKSSMVREALEDFRRRLAQKQLEASANLYAEVYAADDDLRVLTDQAVEGWPE